MPSTTIRPRSRSGRCCSGAGTPGGRLELRKARRAPAVQDFIYLLSPKEILPHRLWRLVTLARNRLVSRREARRYIVVYFCEQPPDPQSRVYLGRNKDRLGLNRLILDWRIPESVHQSLYRLQELLGVALEAHKLGTLERGKDVPHYTDASHHMGTARMGATPTNRRGRSEIAGFSACATFTSPAARCSRAPAMPIRP